MAPRPEDGLCMCICVSVPSGPVTDAACFQGAVFLHVTLWKAMLLRLCVAGGGVLSAATELASCMTGRVACSIGVPGRENNF